MTTKNNRIVFRTKDGKWVNKKASSSKASSLHSSQKEAEEAARIMLRNKGGGDVIVKGLDGKVRSVNTIAPAYHVFENTNSKWSVKKSGTEKAIKIFNSREKAIAFAQEKSKSERNDLVIHSKDGRIRSRDSYGSDPFPPKDRKY